jgi:hypothetical protein
MPLCEGKEKIRKCQRKKRRVETCRWELSGVPSVFSTFFPLVKAIVLQLCKCFGVFSGRPPIFRLIQLCVFI